MILQKILNEFASISQFIKKKKINLNLKN
jgi:hypothetical protein